jgi:hypothetical protein
MRENAETNELYKMQINQLTGIVSFNNSVIVNLIQVKISLKSESNLYDESCGRIRKYDI